MVKVQTKNGVLNTNQRINGPYPEICYYVIDEHHLDIYQYDRRNHKLIQVFVRKEDKVLHEFLMEQLYDY